jgi:hypothetical protein
VAACRPGSLRGCRALTSATRAARTPEPQMPEIKTITLKDGRKRYQFVVDVGRDPATGRRRQKTHTFDSAAQFGS